MSIEERNKALQTFCKQLIAEKRELTSENTKLRKLIEAQNEAIEQAKLRERRKDENIANLYEAIARSYRCM